MTLQNKNILVTGATGGIGRAVCRQLSDSGANLLMVARKKENLEGLAGEISQARPDVTCLSHSVDMTSESSIDDFTAHLATSSTALDGLVLMPPQVAATNDCLPGNDAWRTMWNDSFIGPLTLLKAALTVRRADAKFKIVIISGISSAQVLGHYATSNVLRCAWLAQAKTLAFAYGEQGIHVNTLSLGGTLTPGYIEAVSRRAVANGVSFDQRLGEETSNVPLRKYGTPQEVAVAVESLLSRFSDHITGLNILCDGGFTRSY